MGLALTLSSSEGSYAATGDRDPCPGTDADRCDGAVRAGDGTLEASLTAAVPYASWRASERLKLWGALGYGAGEVTLKTGMGERLGADIDWTMAAAGLRGDVIALPMEGSGLALAVTSDAMWARTTSDKTRDHLEASESDVTRLRLGLEGSYRVALEEGGSLTPKLEVGARHDGGDAET
ncbi:MAG: autotransporter outer membrane beta-barrel domain-containing protein, partial [Rhodospirillaceae bacterium]|nr:autotransporter outer membrane beta-barrel domain-containing protein [Rhodospirillaceae bacterium]